jgi:hypothetical protein
MDALERLVELQIEQNQLLKKYLWRFRFSLLTLLLLTTGLCCGLGFVMYKVNSAYQILPMGAYYGIPPSGVPPTQPFPTGLPPAPLNDGPTGLTDPVESAPASK